MSELHVCAEPTVTVSAESNTAVYSTVAAHPHRRRPCHLSAATNQSGAAERLERPRHSALGVCSARPVRIEEFRVRRHPLTRWLEPAAGTHGCCLLAAARVCGGRRTTISPWVVPMAALEPFRCPTSAGVPPYAALPACAGACRCRHRSRAGTPADRPSSQPAC